VGDWPRMGVESKLWGLDWTFSRLTEAAGDGWGRGGGFHTSNQGGGGGLDQVGNKYNHWLSYTNGIQKEKKFRETEDSRDICFGTLVCHFFRVIFS